MYHHYGYRISPLSFSGHLRRLSFLQTCLSLSSMPYPWFSFNATHLRPRKMALSILLRVTTKWSLTRNTLGLYNILGFSSALTTSVLYSRNLEITCTVQMPVRENNKGNIIGCRNFFSVISWLNYPCFVVRREKRIKILYENP